MPSGAGGTGGRFNVTLEIVRGDNLKAEKKNKKGLFPVPRRFLFLVIISDRCGGRDWL